MCKWRDWNGKPSNECCLPAGAVEQFTGKEFGGILASPHLHPSGINVNEWCLSYALQ